MKKLLAVLLALVLALSCTLAMAETTQAADTAPAADTADAQPFPGLTIESEYDVDRDTLKAVLGKMGMDESIITIIDTIAAVVDQTGEKVVVANEGFQAEVLMKGNSLLNLVGLANDKGITFGSNLIPNYALNLSFEELGDMIAGALQQAAEDAEAQAAEDPTQYLDMEAIQNAFKIYVDDYTETCKTAIIPGEYQQGNYEIDGVTYNATRPMKIDLPTIVDATNELVYNLQNDETIQSALVQLAVMGVEVDFEALDEGYTLTDPATLPAVNVVVYTNLDENGDQKEPFQTAVLATVLPAGETIPSTEVYVKVDGNDLIANADFYSGKYTSLDPEDPNNQPSISVRFSMDTDPQDMFGTSSRLDVYKGEFYVGCAAVTSSTDESILFDAYLYLDDTEKPIVTDRGSIIKDGALTLGVADNVTRITLADLAGEKANDIVGDLKDDLQSGVMSVMTTAWISVPEIGNLISQMIAMLTSMFEESTDAPAEATEPAA